MITKSLLAASLFIIVLAAACGGSSEAEVEQIVDERVSTAIALIPTVIPVPVVPTPTPLPTLTPTPSPTATPTPTATPIPRTDWDSVQSAIDTMMVGDALTRIMIGRSFATYR